MKAFTLSKKSWHWRLATVYGSHDKWDTETDLCAYMRNVIRGVIVISLVIFAGGLCIGIPFGSLLGWMAFVATNGLIEMDAIAFAAVVMIVGIVILIGLFLLFNTDAGEEIIDKIKSTVRIKIHRPQKDSFVVLAYRSFKEKTCVRLSVE